MPNLRLRKAGNDIFIRRNFSNGIADYIVNLQGLRFIREFGLHPGNQISKKCFYHMKQNNYLKAAKITKFKKQKAEQVFDPFASGSFIQPDFKVNLLSLGLFSFLLTALVFTIVNN